MDYDSVKVCVWDNCSAQFLEFEDLYKHLKEVHVNAQNPAFPRDCRWANTCTYQTSEKKHLVSHLRSHLDWRPYSCELCDSKFKHEHEIRRHVDKLHKAPSDTEPNSMKQISPQSFSNNVTSNDSSKGASTSPSGGQYSETDSILSEIIEFGFGYRPFLRTDDDMKNTLLAMGLPLNVLEVPQYQIKRLVLDNFYQSLLMSAYPNNGSMIIDNHAMDCGNSGYNFQPDFIPQGFDQNALNMQFNQQAHLQGGLYQNHAAMAHQLAGTNGDMFYSEQRANGFQPPVHSLGFDTQSNVTSAPFLGYNMNFMNVDSLDGSTFMATRSISNPGASSEAKAKNRFFNWASDSVSKTDSATPTSPNETGEDSPIKKLVSPILNSVIPSIKYLFTGSSPSSPLTNPEETSFDELPESPVSYESLDMNDNVANPTRSDSPDSVYQDTVEISEDSVPISNLSINDAPSSKSDFSTLAPLSLGEKFSPVENKASSKEDVLSENDVPPIKANVTNNGDVSSIKFNKTVHEDVPTIKEDLSISKDTATNMLDNSVNQNGPSAVKEGISISSEDISSIKNDEPSIKDVSTNIKEIRLIEEDLSSAKGDSLSDKGVVPSMKKENLPDNDATLTTHEEVPSINETSQHINDSISVEESVSSIEKDTPHTEVPPSISVTSSIKEDTPSGQSSPTKDLTSRLQTFSV